jgi:glutaredoxin
MVRPTAHTRGKPKRSSTPTTSTPSHSSSSSTRDVSASSNTIGNADSTVADFKPIQNLLHALIGRRTVPNVILDFTSVGGSDEITLLHAEGGLQRRFEEMEVVPGPRRRKLAEKKPTKVELEAPKDAAAEKFEPVVERESIPVEEPASVVRVEADTDTFEPVLEETPSGPDLKRAIDETPIEKRASVPGEPIEARKVEQAVLAFSEEPIRIATPPLEPLEPLSPDQKPIPPHEPKPRAPLEPRTAKAPPPRQPQENGAAAMVAAAKIHKPRI